MMLYIYIDDVSLYECNPISVKELYNKYHFKLYPNPSNEKISLTINSKNQTGLNIKLTDVLGREIKQIEYEEEIDISDLEQGIYFLTVFQNNQLLVTKKIIKQ